MTVSDFETFEKKLFSKLKKNSKKSLDIIKKNEKLLEHCLYNINNVNKFVKDFNDVVLDVKVKKYKLFEEVLNHKLFEKVLDQFRESDVLIRACKSIKRYYQSYEFEDHSERGNFKVIKWLLTMGINYGVQDEKGMTALMYAVKFVKLDFAIEKMMHGKHTNLLDKNGNSVLFHAAENFFSLEKFVQYKDLFNPNHLNNDNENFLLYCSRYGKITSPEFLALLSKFDCDAPNITNSKGKTATMYLLEHGRYKEIPGFVKQYNIDPNYVNKFGNSLVSILIKKYYNFYMKTVGVKEGFGLNMNDFKRYALSFITLADLGCDFKIPVDEDGTSVTMILAKLHDEITPKYLLNRGCVDYLVNEKTGNNYQEVDETNPLIKKNVKTINMWLKETLDPKGTINTRLAGLVMYGLMH